MLSQHGVLNTYPTIPTLKDTAPQFTHKSFYLTLLRYVTAEPTLQIAWVRSLLSQFLLSLSSLNRSPNSKDLPG